MLSYSGFHIRLSLNVLPLKKHGPFRAETVRIVFRKGFYSFTQRIDMPCERAYLLTLKVRLPLTMNMYWP